MVLYHVLSGKPTIRSSLDFRNASIKSVADTIIRCVAVTPYERFHDLTELAQQLQKHVSQKVFFSENSNYLKSGYVDVTDTKQQCRELLQNIEDNRPNSPRTYFIEGTVGAGKSKFLSEIALLCHHKNIPWVAIRSSLDDTFPLAPFSDILEEITLQNFLAAPAIDKIPPLFFDYSQTEVYLQIREQIVDAILTATSNSSLVLLLDDFHLAHPVSVDVIRYLFEIIGGSQATMSHKLMIFVSYCLPDSGHPFYKFLSAEASSQHKITFLKLPALSLKQTGLYVYSALGMSYTPEIFASRIEKLSSGNPLRIYQILRGMLEKGHLYKDEGEWCIDAAGLEESPQTLEQSLEFCLETMNPVCEKILQSLAFSGAPLPASAIFASMDVPGEQIVSAFWHLQASGLVNFLDGFFLELNNSVLGKHIRDKSEGKIWINCCSSLARGIEAIGYSDCRYTFLLSALYEQAKEPKKLIGRLRSTIEKLIDLGLVKQLPEFVEQYFIVSREHGDHEHLLFAAELSFYLKRYEMAIEEYQKLSQQNPESILCLLRLAQAHALNGSLSQAQIFRKKAKELLNSETRPFWSVMYYATYYRIKQIQGATEAALKNNEKALEYIYTHYPKLEQKSKVITLYFHLLSHSYFWEHQSSLALLVNRGIEISQQINQVSTSALLLKLLASLCKMMGKYGEALKNYQQSLALFENMKATQQIIICILKIAELYILMGCYDKATSFLDRAALLSDRNRIPLLQGDYFYLKGLWALRIGDEGEQQLKKALVIYKKQKSKEGEFLVLCLLSEMYLEDEKIQKARQYFEDAQQLVGKLGYPRLLIHLDLLKSAIFNYEDQESPEKITEFLQKALTISQERGYIEYSWQLQYQLGLTHRSRGDIQEALQYFQKAKDIINSSIEGLSCEQREAFWDTSEAKALENYLTMLTTELPIDLAADGAVKMQPKQDAVLLINYQEEMDISHLNKLQEDNSHLHKLLEINKKLLTERNLQKLLELIIDTAIELTNSERGFVILADTSKEKAFEVARNFEKEDIENPQFEVSHSITEKVIQTGLPLLARDAIEDSRFDGFRSVNELQLHSVLAVPLINKGRVIGAVYIDNRFEKAVFSEKEKKFLEAFADQAALAIENARLITDNTTKQEEIENLNRDLALANSKLSKKVENQKQELKEVKNILLRHDLKTKYSYKNIIGKSTPMQELFRILDRVADKNISVLVCGESGTGKELVARAIHYNSPRKENNFLSENCASVADTLLENELFGHVKGAYTGAHADKKGLFEMADKGTLFLDEVGDMSVSMQAALLRVLETNCVRRVGGKDNISIDVRIISASNKNLKQLVSDSEFREDLYFRLKVVQVDLPPLRKRKEDVPLLVAHFLEKYAQEYNTPVRSVDKKAMQLLMKYQWPGNIRELRSALYNVLSLYDEAELTVSHFKQLAETPIKKIEDIFNEELSVDEYARRFVLAYQEHYNDSQIAKILGFSRKTLWEKRKKWDLGKN